MFTKKAVFSLLLFLYLSFGAVNSLSANDNISMPKKKDHSFSFLLNPIPLAAIALKGFGIGQIFEYSYKKVSFSISSSFAVLPYLEPFCSGKIVLYSTQVGFRWFPFLSEGTGVFLGAHTGFKILYFDGNSFLSSKDAWAISPNAGFSLGFRLNFTPKKRWHLVLDVGLMGEFFLSGYMSLQGTYSYRGPSNKYYFAVLPILNTGINF